MSKYGGSEKTTQAFDAAYNKPRLSTRSTQAEAPAGLLLCSGRTNPLSHVSLCTLASSSPGVMWGVDTGRTVPGRCLTGPSTQHRSLTRVTPLPSNHLMPPQIQLSGALGSRLLYKNNMQFYGAHRLPCSSSFQLSRSQTKGQDKTLRGVLKCLNAKTQ